MTDALSALLWYVAIQAVGLAALPVTLRLFRWLPDRGYAFARPLGLLLGAYALWLGATLGLLDNRPATAFVVVGALGVAAWVGLRREVAGLGDLWRRRAAVVVDVEVLFLGAYVAWCLVRAHVPEIVGTEKPMEFAFLNSILRSERFPPADPWLSGYSISYYYFGYVMVALLTRLSGVAPGVAFNLSIATLLAFTATGACSVANNLVAGAQERGRPGGRSPRLAGLLAALFAVVLANWEGIFELLHARGVGSAAFWQGLAIRDLDHPFASAAWYPTEQQDFWWWFRASRVIATSSPNGAQLDYTIDEFPFFSFLLGDLHPHVLALPFAFLAMAFALNLLRSSPGDWAWLRAPLPPSLAWLGRHRAPRLLATLVAYPVAALRRAPATFLAIGVVVGGLGFLNTWDLPTYLFVLTGAFGLHRYLGRPRLDAAWRREVLGFAYASLVVCLVCYLPFYVGFRSQASVPLPVLYRSRLLHFLIFWGPLLFVVGSFLIAQLLGKGAGDLPARRGWFPVRSATWRWTLGVAAALLALQVPPLAGLVPWWLQAPAVAVVLPLLVGAVALLRRGLGRGAVAPEHAFALGLAATGLLLLLGTELVFLNDRFGNRMNTVFKLYYQAWAILAVVAAYGVYYLASRWPGRKASGRARLGARVWLAVGALAIGAGLIYPAAALSSRLAGAGGPPTLDGAAHLARSDPADYAAIAWLREHVAGDPVVLEAPGDSYSQFGRVSANTGLPTLLGWSGHESQWGRSDALVSQRTADADTIYQTPDADAAAALLRSYGVGYVYVGALEGQRYGDDGGAGLTKFRAFLDVVYDRDGVVIYRVRGASE